MKHFSHQMVVKVEVRDVNRLQLPQNVVRLRAEAAVDLSVRVLTGVQQDARVGAAEEQQQT